MVNRIGENQFGLSTVKSMGSAERQETQTRDTRLLCSERSDILTSRSNELSKRRYDKCPKEEVVRLETKLSEPNQPLNEDPTPFTKFMEDMQQRVTQQIFENREDALTIMTEEQIEDMKVIVENALNMKQTLESIDQNLCETPPPQIYKQSYSQPIQQFAPQYETNKNVK